MKPAMREIALERIRILMDIALSNSITDPQLSQRQAMLAKKISERHRIRLPYEFRIMFCKRCKLFLAPGIHSKIRVGSSIAKSVRVSCNFCGHTYRKIISI